MNDIVYRWYLIDNQETCFTCVVGLVPGWHATREEAENMVPKFIQPGREPLFGVRRMDETASIKDTTDKDRWSILDIGD